ncbi:hypothetical protein BBO99_00003398 [Phytophthora kernoviae]|uniref:PDZ domain-containing protein n=2 Tax=Phytophthora kernoviae TaxID=325452 RepID=A0A421GTZ3_9STRA|nr:hypothetical protein G195_003796 [Phytophthora kernoviae 00238/432]KAG2531954.1 hypothetical protein JM16_000585 [Phytophthora kernoviae]KAG2532257.1 hypothetical protein JM18_000706 [Phytophthora kernoviae]RLN25809.1 hypothetical protein BBI17_003037 [Phytophthora kernoviae]RLN81813.1 hypothetical protein BBO99_00003398 [Phytophthora kernoviae]
MSNPFDTFGASGSPMGGGNPMTMPQHQMYPSGANFMTQQGPPAFGGLGGGNQQFGTYNPYQQSMPAPAPMMMQPQYQQSPSNASSALMPMPSYSGEPIMYENIKNIMKPADPFATSPNLSGSLRAPEPTMMPAPPQQHQDPKATIIDFDPFSPKGSTPRTPFDFPDVQPAAPTAGVNDRMSSFGGKRPTQEQQRSQLGFSSESYAAASAKPSTPSISRTNSDDNAPYFLEGNDGFMTGNFANLDDDDMNIMPKRRATGEPAESNRESEERGEVPEECGKDEYDVRFENGRKLGVLMERVDVWNQANQRQETAVVKLVVENGAADRVGVSIGSSVVSINRRSVVNESYIAILDMIKAAPRPLRMRFKRGAVSKDTTQGIILTRISNGTFSVGNLTSGNASWTSKYFAFGGSKMDVLQLFVSRAAYHECVIALYEKRGVHTQIQSFRLCRDHKISPIKCKIYKGYGNLHYFSLTVPSLRFVAAKFASDDYETIKTIWSNTYDAIERKKRMAY